MINLHRGLIGASKLISYLGFALAPYYRTFYDKLPHQRYAFFFKFYDYTKFQETTLSGPNGARKLKSAGLRVGISDGRVL